MTTIGSWGRSAYAATRADTDFRSLKDTLGDLGTQLTTGKKADSWAALGSGVATSLSGRTSLATLAGYAGNIQDAQLRVKLMSTSLQQIGKLSSALSTSLPASPANPIGQTTSQISADDGLKQAIDLLNVDMGGRYLFSGRAGDTAPVRPFALIMDGDAGHAGLKQLIQERKAADLGTAGLGRLSVATTGTDVTLAEEAAGLPFGMKIASATTTSTTLTAATSAGPPPAATLAGAQPSPGDTIEIGLNLPDGTLTKVTLTAGGTGAGTFAIGATLADTMTGLGVALQSAVASAATTTLAAASTMATSTNFFAGTAASPPLRVGGTSAGGATTLAAGTAATTVIWYAGDADAGSARETAPVRVGDQQSVAIGARANEPAIRTLLASLGALAAESFASTDTTSNARYTALTGRIISSVGGSDVKDTITDFGIANKALQNASDRIKIARNQLSDIVDGVENPEPNEVAMKLMAAQTRLQASYQTTALIAKLNLTEYL